MSLGRAPAVAALLFALPFVVVLPVPAASAAEQTAVSSDAPSTPDLLRLDHSSETIRLTPGTTSYWDVRLDVLEENLDTLTVSLGTPSPDEPVQENLLVSASACPLPFTRQGCAAEETVILGPVPFESVSGTAATTLDADTRLGGTVHVRVGVALSTEAEAGPTQTGAPQPVQLILAATAAGVPVVVGNGDPALDAAPRDSGLLADTGAALLPYVALGAGSVIVGSLTAHLARRRRADQGASRPPPDVGADVGTATG